MWVLRLQKMRTAGVVTSNLYLSSFWLRLTPEAGGPGLPVRPPSLVNMSTWAPLD